MADMSCLLPSLSSAKKHAPKRQKILLKCMSSTRLQVDTFVTLGNFTDIRGAGKLGSSGPSKPREYFKETVIFETLVLCYYWLNKKAVDSLFYRSQFHKLCICPSTGLQLQSFLVVNATARRNWKSGGPLQRWLHG